MYNPGVKKNNYKQKTICVLQCNSIHSLNFAGKNLYVIRFNEKRKEEIFICHAALWTYSAYIIHHVADILGYATHNLCVTSGRKRPLGVANGWV